MLFLGFVLIFNVKEKWLSMYDRNPRLYPNFYLCLNAPWTSLQLEKKSTIEINTNWKSIQICDPYVFMEVKRPLDWLKIKTKIEENLNETVKHRPN